MPSPDSMTTEEMVREWIEINESIELQTMDRDDLGYSIQRAMEKERQTVFPHSTHHVEIEAGTPTWDYPKLRGVLEYLDPVALEAARAWTPEHSKTVVVKEKWNMTRLKPFGKQSGDAQEVIEDARIPGRARLKIRPKEARGEARTIPSRIGDGRRHTGGVRRR